MATYKAEIKTVPTGSFYTVTVESGSISTAKQEIDHLYDPISVRNLRQVSNNSSASSSIDDVSGTVGLVGLVAACWVFVSFTPWIAMLAGGAAATWVAEKLCGTSLEGACDDDNDKAVAIILASALIVGGVGFVQGSNWQKEMQTEQSVPAQVQNAK